MTLPAIDTQCSRSPTGGYDDRGSGVAAQAAHLERVRAGEQLDGALVGGLKPDGPGLRWEQWPAISQRWAKISEPLQNEAQRRFNLIIGRASATQPSP